MAIARDLGASRLTAEECYMPTKLADSIRDMRQLSTTVRGVILDSENHAYKYASNLELEIKELRYELDNYRRYAAQELPVKLHSYFLDKPQQLGSGISPPPPVTAVNALPDGSIKKRLLLL